MKESEERRGVRMCCPNRDGDWCLLTRRVRCNRYGRRLSVCDCNPRCHCERLERYDEQHSKQSKPN